MFHTYKLDKFGEKLRDIRKSCGLTQANVRELIGINEDTLRKIENGRVIPKYETIELLSSVYKVDLLKVLISNRSTQLWHELTYKFDKLIISNNLEKLVELSNYLKEIDTDKLQEELIDSNHITQFSCLVSVSVEYYQKTTPFEIILEGLESCLKLTQSDFNYDTFSNKKYTIFELRILLFIGILNAELRKLSVSNQIIEYVFHKLNNDSMREIEGHNLLIKAVSNLAYNNHMLDNPAECLYWANIGIEFCINSKSMYCLPQLYFRKGIAEFNLNHKTYSKSLEKSLYILHLSNEPLLAAEYEKVMITMYNIEL